MNKAFTFRDHRAWLLSLALLAVTAGAYWQVRQNDFVQYDDKIYVTDNKQVQQGLTLQGLRWAFTTTQGANWHPLTWISHMLDCQLFALNPEGHHLTSLLFHLANTLLLFWVLARMTFDPWRSAFVAALFGIHPLHVESVAWVAERKDVLSTFFWLLTFWAYFGYVQRPGVGRYLWIILLFALGLMAKPMLVTLPLTLLLLDYWPLGRFDPKRPDRQEGRARSKPAGQGMRIAKKLTLEKVPLMALALLSSVVTFFAQRSRGAVASIQLIPLPARVANALVSYVEYLQKMIWPARLAVFYPHPGNSIRAWQVAGSFLLLAVVTLVVMRAARRRPYLPVGWLWYLVTLLPVIGLVQVGEQAMADRYSYMPLVGIFIIVAWGGAELLEKWSVPKAGAGLAAVAIIAVLAVITSIQVAYWRNNLTLFEHALQVVPRNYQAHNDVGAELAEKGRTVEAVYHLRQALRLNPRHAKAHFNLGLIVAGEGNTGEAIAQYHEALRLDPNYAEAHMNLGVALAQQGKISEALDHYSRALQISPDYAEAHINMGIELATEGKMNEAVEHFSRAVEIKPNSAEAHYNLGKAYLFLKNRSAALEQYNILKGLNSKLADDLLNVIGQ
ncbi:MAG TPA: tetratricopeptide repeat protein [Acidobacteriota bacterium]|jgi:tetratricopeptide (TPR) repeat protein